ncbi:uncharacterized protein LOC128983671 [Macrosteles quadrilineatus]|uniref:uncharacterized protein LOC128983671 n=1 Tax=Macrosteles quadrilineatus TaxID=74068 RepID=UPI0023E1D5C3|nr:uncharacterized protein LOC128983671 [Macrosteles quadrilineatus]
MDTCNKEGGGEPSASEPLLSELPSSKPLLCEQTVSELPATEPLLCEQTANEPLVGELPASDPLLREQTASEPLVCEQAASEPLVCEQTESEPLLCEQAANEPLVSELPASEPLVCELPATEPLICELPANGPLICELPANGPLICELPANGPLVSELPASEPLVCELPATEPLICELLPPNELLSCELSASEPLACELPANEPLVSELPATEPLICELLPPNELLSCELSASEPLACELPANGPLVSELPASEPLVCELPATEPLICELLPPNELLSCELSASEPLACELPANEPLACELPANEPLVYGGKELALPTSTISQNHAKAVVNNAVDMFNNQEEMEIYIESAEVEPTTVEVLSFEPAMKKQKRESNAEECNVPLENIKGTNITSGMHVLLEIPKPSTQVVIEKNSCHIKRMMEINAIEGKFCSVDWCFSTSMVDEFIKFYCFPSHDKDLCKQWIRYCEDESLYQLPPNQLLLRKICEKHFSDNCFIKKILKNTASPIPVTPLDDELFLSNGVCENYESSDESLLDFSSGSGEIWNPGPEDFDSDTSITDVEQARNEISNCRPTLSLELPAPQANNHANNKRLNAPVCAARRAVAAWHRGRPTTIIR